MRELIRNVWKFVLEVKVKCGTFTPNAWSFAGLAASEITERRRATGAAVWRKHRLSVLLAELKERRSRQGAPWMPKRNRGNEYMCKGETRTVNYWCIGHIPPFWCTNTMCLRNLKENSATACFVSIKCELQIMYNIVSCTFDWYFVVVC